MFDVILHIAILHIAQTEAGSMIFGPYDDAKAWAFRNWNACGRKGPPFPGLICADACVTVDFQRGKRLQ